MRDDAVLRRALPLGRGLGRVKHIDTNKDEICDHIIIVVLR